MNQQEGTDESFLFTERVLCDPEDVAATRGVNWPIESAGLGLAPERSKRATISASPESKISQG